jgi:hypothetical protein
MTTSRGAAHFLRYGRGNNTGGSRFFRSKSVEDDGGCGHRVSRGVYDVAGLEHVISMGDICHASGIDIPSLFRVSLQRSWSLQLGALSHAL